MKIDNRDVFEQIGNLFFAIAADQHVKPLESGELKSLIRKDWLPRNLKGHEPFVSNETHVIVMAMDALEGNKTASRDAFSEFAKFFRMHPEVFSEEIRGRILSTAEEITQIFQADNPVGNSQLVALKDLMGLGSVQQV